MHYHWQILVKADNKTDGKDQLDSVMESVSNSWDWYEIGGRWNEKPNIINAASDKFWNRIEQALTSQAEALQDCQQMLKRELKRHKFSFFKLNKLINQPKAKNGEFSTALHCLWKISMLRNGWYCSDSYLATASDIWGSPELPQNVIDTIKQQPKSYWLINLDIHN